MVLVYAQVVQYSVTVLVYLVTVVTVLNVLPVRLVQIMYALPALQVVLVVSVKMEPYSVNLIKHLLVLLEMYSASKIV